jgi:hypothetical protein
LRGVIFLRGARRFFSSQHLPLSRVRIRTLEYVLLFGDDALTAPIVMGNRTARMKYGKSTSSVVVMLVKHQKYMLLSGTRRAP